MLSEYAKVGYYAMVGYNLSGVDFIVNPTTNVVKLTSLKPIYIHRLLHSVAFISISISRFYIPSQANHS